MIVLSKTKQKSNHSPLVVIVNIPSLSNIGMVFLINDYCFTEICVQLQFVKYCIYLLCSMLYKISYYSSCFLSIDCVSSYKLPQSLEFEYDDGTM